MPPRKSRLKPAPKRGRTAAPADFPAPKEAQSRTQLGVRIAEATHRQLQLAAVMRGMTVQTLVEQAMLEFFASHPELLQNGLAVQQRSKSTPTTSR
jgi:hypothetical protein